MKKIFCPTEPTNEVSAEKKKTVKTSDKME